MGEKRKDKVKINILRENSNTLFFYCPKIVVYTFTYLQYVVLPKLVGSQPLLICNTKPGENPNSLFRIFQYRGYKTHL